MSYRSDHHLPAANDAALDLTGSQRTNTDSDQQPNSPLPKSSGPASLYGEHPLLPPSSQCVTEPTDAPLQPHLARNPETSLAFGIPSTSEQSLMPAGPSTSSRQPLQSTAASSPFRRSDDIADMPPNSGPESISRSGHPSVFGPSFLPSMRVQGLTSYWQSPLGNEPEINSVALDHSPATHSSNVSTDNLFRISSASKEDLDKVARLHAQVFMHDTLSRCSIQRRADNMDAHIKIGQFHYDQAFAARGEAVIMIATDQVSGEVVGCAWLQLHAFPTFPGEQEPSYQPGSPLDPSLDWSVYRYVHDKRQKQRETASLQRGRDMAASRHYSIRSLDIATDLSTEHRSEVHRKLVSQITAFRPEFDIFAEVSHAYCSDIDAFLKLGWEDTGKVVLGADDCPSKHEAWRLEPCSTEERTLNGLLRASTKPSPAWPKPTVETWSPPTPPNMEELTMPVASEGISTELAQQVPQPEHSRPLGPSTQKPRGLRATVTINLVVDGTRPYQMAKSYAFKYLSYRNVSAKQTMRNMIRNLRWHNRDIEDVRDMEGVCSMFCKKQKHHVWYPAATYLDPKNGRQGLKEAERVDRSMLEAGWGRERDTTWLCVED